MSIMELTHANFDKTVEKHDLVVIDFWAKWCVPCLAFTKVIEELSKTYPDVVFGSVDIEVEKELAEDFNIMSVPAIMILRSRVVVYAGTGALTQGAMRELIEQAKKLSTEELIKKPAH